MKILKVPGKLMKIIKVPGNFCSIQYVGNRYLLRILFSRL